MESRLPYLAKVLATHLYSIMFKIEVDIISGVMISSSYRNRQEYKDKTELMKLVVNTLKVIQKRYDVGLPTTRWHEIK